MKTTRVDTEFYTSISLSSRTRLLIVNSLKNFYNSKGFKNVKTKFSFWDDTRLIIKFDIPFECSPVLSITDNLNLGVYEVNAKFILLTDKGEVRTEHDAFQIQVQL